MDNLAYQEEIWEELLDGKLVAMSPRPAINHDIIAGNIYRKLADYLQGKKCAAFGEVDVYLTDRDRVIPDTMVVCNRDIIKNDGIHGPPDLVVEVLSPRSAVRDRGYKMRLYEKCGVKEYWIASPESSTLEDYVLVDGKYELVDVYAVYEDWMLEKMSEAEIAGVRYEFSPAVFPELTIKVADVFEGMF